MIFVNTYDRIEYISLKRKKQTKNNGFHGVHIGKKKCLVRLLSTHNMFFNINI